MNLTRKSHTLLIILFISSQYIITGQIQSQNLKELSDHYALKVLKKNYPESEGYTYGEDHTLHHPDHDFTLGHIRVDINKKSKGDFNNDGYIDYWGSVFDEGMGGGGNMFSYELGVFQIEQNDVLKFIPIFDGSKFSDISYTLQGFKNGKPLIGVGINFQGSYDSAIEVDEIIEIMFKNDQIIPVSYDSNCQMAEMTNKNIFKETLDNVLKKQVISPFLDILQEEKYNNDDASYIANIYGCKDFFLEFSIKVNQKKDPTRAALESFDFLIEHTRFSSIVKKLKLSFQKQGFNDSDYIKHLGNWFSFTTYTDTEDGLILSTKYYQKN